MCLSVLRSLERALFYDDQLLVGMCVRRMGRLARVECRDMTLQLIKRSRWRSKELTRSTGPGLLNGDRIPVKDSGTHDRRIGACQSADEESNAYGNKRD